MDNEAGPYQAPVMTFLFGYRYISSGYAVQARHCYPQPYAIPLLKKEHVTPSVFCIDSLMRIRVIPTHAHANCIDESRLERRIYKGIQTNVYSFMLIQYK